MIKVTVIGSSSKGNCIVISDGTSSLMLDAGLPFRKIQKAVDLNDIEAALITHLHRDHCLAMPNLCRRGIPVYANESTFDSFPNPVALGHVITGQRQFDTGNWIVLPFDSEHDVPCLGFLIQSKSTRAKIVYAVDMPRINFDFPGVTHWFVEANYSNKLLEESKYEEFLKDRIRRSHMSVENLIKFLKSSDLSKTEGIWLCHLSDANSDEKAFIEQVQRATGKPVHVAGGWP